METIPCRSGKAKRSQPYVVALMTEVLRLGPVARVLEIGTGSGYQAAVLALIVQEVFTIEIRRPLAEKATKTLADLGYRNVTVKFGDGYVGWESQAPPPLIKRLKEGGRLIVPLGSTVYFQTLTLATKRNGELDVEQLCPVAFVPMTGEMQRQ